MSQLEADPESEDNNPQTSHRIKSRRYDQPPNVTNKAARDGQHSTKHWTSAGTTATTESRMPPLADHQQIVEGGVSRTDKLT